MIESNRKRPVQAPGPGEISMADWSQIFQSEVCKAFKKARYLNSRSVPFQYDLNDAMGKRREKAFLNTLDVIYELFGGKYSESYMESVDLGCDWLKLCLFPCSYTAMENEMHIICGASVWMLDRIGTTEEKQAELMSILQETEGKEEEEEDQEIFSVWDPVHGDSMIRRMSKVIRDRNRDCGKPEKTADGRRVLTDSVTAEGKNFRDAASRHVFESVMLLIPAEERERAVLNFERYFSEWVDRYFRCASIVRSEAVSVRETMARKINQLLELGKACDELEKGTFQAACRDVTCGIPMEISEGYDRYFTALLMEGEFSEADDEEEDKDDPFDGTIKMSPESVKGIDPALVRRKRCRKRLEKLSDECESAWTDLREKRRKDIQFKKDCVLYGADPAKNYEEMFGREVAAQMRPLTIPDPFEACFAFLYLIEKGSDIPWLYGPCMGLMREVSRLLPWAAGNERPERIPDPDGQESGTGEEITDWFEMKYSRKTETGTVRKNLAQLLYEETGCLMPRLLTAGEDEKSKLKEAGVPEAERLMLLTAKSTLEQARKSAEVRGRLAAEAFQKALEKAEEHETVPQEEIEGLFGEIRRLEKLLSEAEHRAAKARAELITEKNSYASERRELADLRDTLFILQNPEEEEKPLKTKVSFPYEVRENTIVIGGHESWEKAIRPLLSGNIRFISKNLNFDPVIIRNADVIWIQTNAICHSQYNRVMKAARQYNKPIRYFAYSGAEKGAVQIAENDQEKERSGR